MQVKQRFQWTIKEEDIQDVLIELYPHNSEDSFYVWGWVDHTISETFGSFACEPRRQTPDERGRCVPYENVNRLYHTIQATLKSYKQCGKFKALENLANDLLEQNTLFGEIDVDVKITVYTAKGAFPMHELLTDTKYSNEQKALHEAIFGDSWYKLVSHKDFFLWSHYVLNKQETKEKELFDKIMREVA